MRFPLLSVLAFFFSVSVWAAPTPSLKEAAGAAPLMGVALGGTLPGALSAAEQALVVRHFNVLTPENCMKPEAIHPTERQWDWAMADAFMAYAESLGLPVIGHTLVWHSQCPDWFFEDGGKPASRELVLARMRDHIHTLVGRYKGRIAAWDVVNEAIADEPGVELRPSKWLQAIGEDYIEQAFRFAHEADPAAQLIYNDYSNEGAEKRAKTVAMIKRLQAKGVPIHGVGIQGHWLLSYAPMAELARAIDDYAALGLKVAITELDIDVMPRETTGADVGAGVRGKQVGAVVARPLSAEAAAQQAAIYRQLFEVVAARRDKVSRVTFWGLHDGRSWLNQWPTPRYNHAMLFDRELQEKPVYRAVIDALQGR